MRARDFIREYKTVPFRGIEMSMAEGEDGFKLTARSPDGRKLGFVEFSYDTEGTIRAEELEVDERYRGQGIAATMYDYVKSLGYRIRRSGQQTDAGAGFWNRYRPEANIWESELDEVQILSKVKGKGAEPSRLPRLGREIPAGQEEQYLGRYVTDVRPGQQLWQQYVSGEMNYHLFDTDTRRAVLTMFGTRYPRNPQSIIVLGVYASPDNTVRASDFYRFLITRLGLTMVSDRKQSPGGQNIWRQLERSSDVEVYGMDTRTGEVLNIGAGDEEMYAVPPGAAKSRETKYTAKNIRLVATAR